MDLPLGENVVELSDLRNRNRVFRDRRHAGEVMATMLADRLSADALLLAVPAGGVPVAAEVARRLELPLDVAVVSKVTLPWNSEAGYGAVAFDGTVRLNRGLATRVGLSEEQMTDGVERTIRKVERRVRRMRGKRPWPELAGRPVVLVDDGLASGFTMLVAVEAVATRGAERVVVAAPTAPLDTVQRLVERAHEVVVANIRTSYPFAVADAYQRWSDVDEDDAIAELREFLSRDGDTAG